MTYDDKKKSDRVGGKWRGERRNATGLEGKDKYEFVRRVRVSHRFRRRYKLKCDGIALDNIY